MSREFSNWKKPKRDQRQRYWNRNVNQRPPGLRGREIGLYYKNQVLKKLKTEFMISLTIPPSVITTVKNNLHHIFKIAQAQSITLPDGIDISLFDDASKDLYIKEEVSEDHEESNDQSKASSSKEGEDFVPVKKCFDPLIKDNSCIKKEISTLPEFIPVKKVDNFYTKQFGRQLSLRESTCYKYDYKDIITGTFDDKLQECMSKGISINITNQEINDLSIAMNEEFKDIVKRDRYIRLLKFRQLLPTFKKSKEIINVINNNQVVVISGETGCGKSTQIPQIILDEAISNNRGANVKIMVTQPRRIAASSLAARVAQERGECMGNSVGYSVRLERVEERARGSIQYCTTGVLLVELEVNQALTNYSHIILDEVHERDSNVDLTMCMLKKVLKKRKDLKLILMSATLDAESLSAYFENCPVMLVEGLAYPVQDVYLEEILQMTKFQLKDEPVPKNRPKWHKFARHKSAAKDMEKDIKYKAEIGPWLESIKRTLDPQVYKTLQDSRIEDLNMELILELLINISKGDPGAVLIFLPGIGDISKLLNMMNDSNHFPNSRFDIYPLHSKLPSLDQNKIFEKPPERVRKIVIATNIAETSITIDDVVYVIDCGKLKISGFNVEEKTVTLQTDWVSKANLHQRRGRAGRCQPGICYHLMTSYRAQKLESRLLPELQRSDLLESVLSIKRLRMGLAAEALNTVPSPPNQSTIEWAVMHLQQCGALDEKEVLTPLGWHLARLPVHPAAGKLLLLGALFGCLDRAASVASVWSFKDPFQIVLGRERDVEQAKRNLALGEPSDHVAISEGIMQWEKCRTQREKLSFAYEHFLSHKTLELLIDMKKQLGDSLKQMGFLASGRVTSAWENRNTNNLSLFKAIVAAALYPNIACVKWNGLNSRNPNKIKNIRAFFPDEGKFTIHPSSVMATPKGNPMRIPRSFKLCDNPGANWLVYRLKQRSSDLFLFDVTLIYTLPLLFFGQYNIVKENDEKSDECVLSIKAVKVRCKKETADILYKLRMLLDKVLASKIMVLSDHSTNHCRFEEEVLNAVSQLITAEDEQTEYLGADLSESDNSECE